MNVEEITNKKISESQPGKTKLIVAKGITMATDLADDDDDIDAGWRFM